VSAISKEEPEEQEIPGLDARAREGTGLAGAGVDETDTDGPADAARPVSREDYALVRSILPGSICRRLDAAMVAMVAGKARERIEAGWSADEVGSIVTSQRWPTQVHSWGHLVAKRIDSIPLDCAPERVVFDDDDEATAEGPAVPWVAPPWQAALDAAKARHEPGTGFLNRATWVKAWLDTHSAEVKAWQDANPGYELPVPPAPPARPAPPADGAGVVKELVAA